MTALPVSGTIKASIQTTSMATGLFSQILPNSSTSFAITVSSGVTIAASFSGRNAVPTARSQEDRGISRLFQDLQGWKYDNPYSIFEFKEPWYQLSRHDLRLDPFSSVSGHPTGLMQQEAEFLRNIDDHRTLTALARVYGLQGCPFMQNNAAIVRDAILSPSGLTVPPDAIEDPDEVG
ncbi:hypothetical protein K438DRAFT_1787399 [Mycena galopus ATCC 62051]|nr:hypothetical protein K438DRAFT_1787399 [Mycena galopus ATCC 62051]